MIGQKLSHYRITAKLGEGGMGEVYRAEDTELLREVAIKVLLAEIADDPERLERFRREAQAVAALNHPNIVTIFSVEEVDGLHFLTMELVQGQSLDRLIPKNGFPLEAFFNLAVPVADALRAAHHKGIIHRDLKPSNLMVDDEGRIKILDFGLAKLQSDAALVGVSQMATEALTSRGIVVGTVPYMSPEQIEGKGVDGRSDIFSFGIVLHEMATGLRPFQGDSGPGVMSAILKDTPAAVTEIKDDLPRHLGRIIRHCLEKDPDHRFQTARDVHNDLKALQDEVRSGVDVATGTTPMQPPVGKSRRTAWISAAVVLAVLTIGAALWLPYRSRRNVERARALIPEVEQLAAAEQYAEAYELAVQIEEHAPDELALAILMPEISDTLIVDSDPQGATVHLQRFPEEAEEVQERSLVGTTPITGLRIARADYRLWLEKDGFETPERVISSTLNRAEARMAVEPEIVLEETLRPEGSIPEGMVFVPGGEYNLRGSGFRGMDSVVLNEFFADTYEVSNQDYQEFIRSGGYSEPAYWQHPFVRDGVEIPFAKAMEVFRDRSGLGGPREWSNQEYPDGRGNHPVTGVSWYEAAAYAEYVGKSLPTIYQWEKAARGGRWTHFEGIVMPWGLAIPGTPSVRRANYLGRDSAPIDSYPFGIGPYGAYNMAGNVEEWCLNERGAGRATAGGSWADANYLFPTGSARPAFDASNTIGFRCVSKPAAGAGDQGSGRIEPKRTPTDWRPVDDETYESYLSHYRYDKKSAAADLLEKTDTPDWTREKITLEGAGADRIIAYLYLPKRAQAPYQCINYIVSGTVFQGRTAPEEVEAILSPQIKAGRAVMVVVPKYAIERDVPAPPPADERGPVWLRNTVLRHVAEFRMGLDYLETREEIDMSRIAHIGFSWGAVRRALIFNAVEPRIRSSIFIGGGLIPTDRLPEINAVNFVPRITAPVLVLTGRYDEVIPYEPAARALFEQLTAPKRLELVETGHLPPVEIRNPIISEFLDETLGPLEH